MKKKGLEVSINFLVMIIISLVIFIFAITFAFRFFGQAEQYRKQVDENTRREIENIIINQGQRVAAYPTQFELFRGKDEVFGLGVFNIDLEAETEFNLNVSCSRYVMPDETLGDAEDPDACPKITIMYSPKSVMIKPNGDYIFTVYVKNNAALPGTYILNAEVTYLGAGGILRRHGDVQKIYVRSK